MTRLLIQIGRKIMMLEDGKVLIPYDGKLGDALSEWVCEKFSIIIVREELNNDWNLDLITAVLTDEFGEGTLISIPNAINRIDDGETEVKDYLRAQRAMLGVQLKFGVNNGKIVCISEIFEEQRGLKCNCTCPGCGMPLQARLGEKKQRHFAHSNTSCDIVSAQQTALHMLAKEIIEEEKTLLLPGIVVKRSETSFRDSGNYLVSRLPSSLEYRTPRKITCESVFLEKRISDIIPDIVITVAGKPCLVEIAVTHFVDDNKEEKIKKLGLPLLEIDISSLYGSDFDKAQIHDAILNKLENKRWVYNPLTGDARLWAEQEYNTHFQKARDEEKKQQEKQIEAEKRRSDKREATASKLEKLFIPCNYKAALISLRDDKKSHETIKGCLFARDLSTEIPFFVDLPITGEMIFACDRRIWQCAIFDRFIYNRKNSPEDPAAVNIKKVQKWLISYQNVIPVDWTLASKAYLHINGHGKNYSLIYDVIKRYLEYLSEIGFISSLSYQEAKIMQSHTIIPPNTQRAEELKTILQTVNTFDPDIDDLLDRVLHREFKYRLSYYDARKNEDMVNEEERVKKQILMEQTRRNEYKLGYEAVNAGSVLKFRTVW